MRGGIDEMFEDLVAIIHSGDKDALAKNAVAPPRRRLVPEFMLKLARSVSPFKPLTIALVCRPQKAYTIKCTHAHITMEIYLLHR